MTTRLTRQASGIAGLGVVAVMVTACGGGSAKVAAAAVSPGGSQAAAAATAGDASAAALHATGGGKFCTEIAASMNSQKTPTGDASGTDVKKQIDDARAEAHHALSIAPSAIKSDVALLVAASDSMYDALAKVGDDYSKLTAADMTAFSSPKVVAAEQRLTAYVKDSCGIDLGGQAVAGASAAAAAGSGDANAAADAATASGIAALGSSASGAACNLATIAEVSAGAGKAMKMSGGEGNICVYGAVDDPGFFIYAKVYDDTPSMESMTQVETGSTHLDSLGDDAFWNAIIGTVFVRKGTRGFSFALPSLANLTSNPDGVKANMVALATAAAGRF